MDEADIKNLAVVFTAQENAEIQKLEAQIQNTFAMNHPEIISKASSDLTQLLRDEKHMYANLAIGYTVRMMCAMKKKKET
jgi:hypothetical protein